MQYRSRFRKEPIKFWDGVQMIIISGFAVIAGLVGGLAPFVIGAYIAMRLMKMGC